MGDVIEVLTISTNTVEVAATGPQGAPGVGVPTGGSALQVLRKVSSTDYDTEWATGGGGSVDLSSPDPIGDVTPNTGAFTTLSATGTATLPHIHGSLAGNLYIHVKNTSGGQLTRGTPVYIVGNVGDTDRVEVAAADFDDVTKMPAVALLEQTLANNGSGDAIILGELDEANTNAYTINTELFVGNNGAMTSTRPTTGQVQSVGVVARVNSNTGVIVVNMQGQRSPNETFAAASHTHGNLTNAGAIGTTSGLPVKTGTSGVIEAGAFGTEAGTFAEGNDSRLTDARTPNSTLAHAASHHTGGTDALAVRDLGGISIETRSIVSYSTDQTLAAARNTRLFVSNTNASGINLDLPIGSAGTLEGDTYTLVGGTTVSGPIIIRRNVLISPSVVLEIARITAVGQSFTVRSLGTETGSWEVVGVNAHTHAAADITSGTLDVARLPVGTGSTSVIAPTIADAKGDLIVASAADTVARLAVGGTNGHVLTVDSAETLGVKWAAAAGGITAVGSTVADILSVSGSDLVADDLGADKLYGWDDSAGKAIGYTIGSGLETDTTTLKTKITSDPSGVSGADAITNIMSLTQAEYNAIGSPNAATLFLITDP